MRVTENRLMQMMTSSSANARAKVAEASAKISSGVAVDRPSDDPAAWAEGMRQKVRLVAAEESSNSAQRAVERLDATDQAFGRMWDAMVRVKELATQMSNGTYEAADRAAAALEVEGLFAEMIAAGNTRGSDGEYLLAGHQSDTAPFDDTGAYFGDDQERWLVGTEGELHRASVPGSVLTAADGVDVLATVATFAAALQANDTTALAAVYGDVEAATDQVASARSRAGSASAALSANVDALGDLQVALTASIESAVLTDPIEAATELARFSNQLEASRIVAERIASLVGPGR